MPPDATRRRLLVSTATLAGASALGRWHWPLHAAPPDDRRFAFEHLIAHARGLADRPYDSPESRHAALLDELGYDTFMGIHADREHSLWHGADLPVTVEFFQLDQNARVPVALHVVDADGRARRLDYRPSLFRYDDPELEQRLPADLGFAGFRVRDATGDRREWCAFKGASYFRSPGALDQYGLSARGVAVDTGYGAEESFPHFTAYWLLRPAPEDTTLTVCALLEGEDLTGAYRFEIGERGAVMDVESHLFQRHGIRRLGIAPLTSMFWFSETNARRGTDWRPELHDSDGLAMITGRGEHLWRALGNPPRTHYSAFGDTDPRAFGLLQRDRDFDHYQDAAVHYERRPSLWVIPSGDWGPGHVGLLELPTAEEVYDNINAFWVPEGSDRADARWRFDYRLDWRDRAAPASGRAQVVATRTGRAGDPGSYDDQSVLARKFVIDFEGGALPRLADDTTLDVRASASHGDIVNPYVRRVTGTPRWRAFFDWSGAPPPSDEPVELRCVLARGDRLLTETWLFAYFPQALPTQIFHPEENA